MVAPDIRPGHVFSFPVAERRFRFSLRRGRKQRGARAHTETNEPFSRIRKTAPFAAPFAEK